MVAKLTRIIVPTGFQAFLSLLISIVLLGVIFRDHLVSWISGSSGVSLSQLQTTYHSQLTSLTRFGFMPDLTIGIFWAGVGIVGYVVMVELVNVFISAHNELVVDTTFTNRGSAAGKLARLLLRLGLAAIFFIYLLVAIKVLLPAWTGLAGHWLLGDASLTAVLQTLLAVVGLAASLYAGWMLGVVMKNYH